MLGIRNSTRIGTFEGVRNHGKDFVAIMDQYMPYWRETRKLLNDLKLDYMEEDERGDEDS